MHRQTGSVAWVGSTAQPNLIAPTRTCVRKRTGLSLEGMDTRQGEGVGGRTGPTRENVLVTQTHTHAPSEEKPLEDVRPRCFGRDAWWLHSTRR